MIHYPTCNYTPQNLEFFAAAYSRDVKYKAFVTSESRYVVSGIRSEESVGIRPFPILLQCNGIDDSELKELCRSIFSTESRCYLTITNGQKSHHEQLLSMGWRANFDIVDVVQLFGLDLAEIKRGVRKSFKSLIVKQDNVFVAERNYEHLVRQCKDIHFLVSGKKTRSEASWSAMAKSLKEGQAILTYSAKDETLTGYNYFFLNRNDAYYTSAVTLDHTNGHPLMWRAITILHKRAVKNLILNITPEDAELSAKEENIIKFKRGFACKPKQTIVYTKNV